MKLMLSMAILAPLFLGFGCSSTSDSDDPDPLPYPDIDGLVVYYPFDGNLENAVADEHHGSVERSALYVDDRLGRAESAVHVSDEFIIVPDHADLDITAAITLATWVKPELSNLAYCAVIDKGSSDGYSLGVHGGSAPDLESIKGFINGEFFHTEDLVPFGQDQWSHIAFTYRESAPQAKFFLNGAPVDSSSVDVEFNMNDKDLRIGVSFHGDRYIGAIDNAAIFDRALSDAEVAELCEFE